jgi:hypothetical protein
LVFRAIKDTAVLIKASRKQKPARAGYFICYNIMWFTALKLLVSLTKMANQLFGFSWIPFALVWVTSESGLLTTACHYI